MSFIVLDSRSIAISRKVEEAIFATCYHFYYPIFLLLATSTSWRRRETDFLRHGTEGDTIFSTHGFYLHELNDFLVFLSNWQNRYSYSRYLKQYYIQLWGSWSHKPTLFSKAPRWSRGRLQGSCSTTVGPPWMSWRCTFQAVQGRRRQISLAKTHWWSPFSIQRWQLDILCKWRF